jgi:23S rRNA A1618 N6-methylase RlmF
MSSTQRCQSYSYTLIPASSPNGISKSEFVLSCNFDELAEEYPEFKSALSHSPQEHKYMQRRFNQSTKFNKALTRCLLHHHFNLKLPSLPEGRLVPPIPNRGNYVMWLRELISSSVCDLNKFSRNRIDDSTDINVEGEHQRDNQNQNENISTWQFQGIDIGTGVSAIYPLLLSTKLFAQNDTFHIRNDSDRHAVSKGTQTKAPGTNQSCRRDQTQQHNNVPWKFLATDIDPLAVESARINVKANHLENRICVVQVKSDYGRSDLLDDKVTGRIVAHKGPLYQAMQKAKCNNMFQNSEEINTQDGTSEYKMDISTYPKFDFVMTNPPFYSTLKEAAAPRIGDKRSRTEMSSNESVYCQSLSNTFDYDKKDAKEQSNDGGDVGFIMAIMRDSQYFRVHVTWYTSLIAKRSSLDEVLRHLQTLDGVWGNRGQIRTVEFRQGSEHDCVQDGTSKNDGPSICSPRVRWGIGWTYERASARCSTCRVMHGLTSFSVLLSEEDLVTSGATSPGKHSEINPDNISCCKNDTACNEVVSRLMAYFGSFRETPLRCICPAGSRCVTVIEERPLSTASQKEYNDNLPIDGHFIMDSFVSVAPSNAHSNESSIVVNVRIEMWSHTKRGDVLLNKIRDLMPGEVGRSNRKWRRRKKLA